MIYSLDDAFAFDPYDLDIDITPEEIRRVRGLGDWIKALIMALRLGETDVVVEVMEAVPAKGGFLCLVSIVDFIFLVLLERGRGHQ